MRDAEHVTELPPGKAVRAFYEEVVVPPPAEVIQLRGWDDFPERVNMWKYVFSPRYWYTDSMARVEETKTLGYVRNPSVGAVEGRYNVRAYVLLQDGCRVTVTINGVVVIDHTHSGPEAHYWVGPVTVDLLSSNDIRVDITQPTRYGCPGVGGVELAPV